MIYQFFWSNTWSIISESYIAVADMHIKSLEVPNKNIWGRNGQHYPGVQPDELIRFKIYKSTCNWKVSSSANLLKLSWITQITKSSIIGKLTKDPRQSIEVQKRSAPPPTFPNTLYPYASYVHREDTAPTLAKKSRHHLLQQTIS